MSRFIKSTAELSALRSSAKNADKQERVRISGFTEAEREASEWVRKQGLVEVEEKLARSTNLDVRQPRHGIPPGLAAHKTIRYPEMEHQKTAARRSSNTEVQEGKENKKEKKNKKAEKKKDRKDEKKLDKGARKLAKKMRKEEKQRKRQDKLLKAGGVDHRIQEDQVASVAGGHNLVDALESTSGPLNLSSSAIEQLIEAARLAGAPDEGAAQQLPLPDTLGNVSSAAEIEASVSQATINSVAPRDPENPLKKAHDLEEFNKLQQRRFDTGRPEIEEQQWDHLPYLRRSPSPCRLRTAGTMWPTRLGTWKSRAGGAYLPPTDQVPEAGKREKENSLSLSPARYAYPEEFSDRLFRFRRSPSYNPEPRRDSASSSPLRRRSPSLSRTRSRSRPHKKKRKQKEKSSSSSSSLSERPSPVYELEAGAGDQQTSS